MKRFFCQVSLFQKPLASGTAADCILPLGTKISPGKIPQKVAGQKYGLRGAQ
jgi:hypothetical protein